MSDIQVEERSLRVTGRSWEELDELMRRARRELQDAPTGGLPTSARAAADRFRQAWSQYAGESARTAAGLSRALAESAAAYETADVQAGDRYDRLDARLGPTR